MRATSLRGPFGLLLAVTAAASCLCLTAGQLSGQAPTAMIDQLADDLDVSTEQATAVAESLFGIAAEQLPADQWEQVSDAVPGIDGMVDTPPDADAQREPLAGDAAGAGLAAATSAFQEQGLAPSQVSTAVSSIGNYISGTGGPEVANIFTSLFR